MMTLLRRYQLDYNVPCSGRFTVWLITKCPSAGAGMADKDERGQYIREREWNEERERERGREIDSGRDIEK